MNNTKIVLLMNFYFFLFSTISFGQQKEIVECGSDDLTNIPFQSFNHSTSELFLRENYNIDLALHVIYGKYDQTDITVSVTVNENFSNASFVVYDIFSKHWVIDDIVYFTEPNQTIQITIPNIVGPHYIQAYGPDENTIITASVSNENGQIIKEWSPDDYITLQEATSTASVYFLFDTGDGDTSVGNISENELTAAINRLNDNMQFSQLSFSIDTINRVHNNEWALGLDIGSQTYESVPALSINPTEKLNVFSIIGYSHNLALGGVGIFPWYLETWDSTFYRVTVKSFYYTDQAYQESRSHVFDHEVGHALGLLHTFNYGCGSSQHGDYVDDTPTHAGANWGCADGTDSCPDDPGLDPVDNLMNYVYSTDCPMSPFTPGQGTRAIWAINNWVPTLIDTIPPTVWYVSENGSDESGDGSEEYPFASIQNGLDISYDGDTVLVTAGTYTENINWPMTNGISLIGSGQDNCIIDGDSSGAVITISDSLGGIIDSMTLITGFTIQNGSAAGVVFAKSSPKITNCIVDNNLNSIGDGGGIIIADSSSAIIQNVTISNNISRYQYFVPGPGGPRYRGNGGGLFIAGSNPKLINVIISDNESTYHGGGVSVLESSPVFIDCIISGNNSGFTAGGFHGIGRLGAHFIGGKIHSNRSTGPGGGVHIDTPGPVDSSHISFTDVDIFLNHAGIDGGGGGSDGGGISIGDPIVLNLAGCSIRNNSAQRKGGGISFKNQGYYDQGQIVFSTTNRNNIHSNFIEYAGNYPRGQGVDFHIGENIMMDVVLDTFTVLTPTEYYCTPIENYTFEILNSVSGNVINSDLFVSVDGNNNNSGLSFENAFKTIEHALSKIFADSMNINTIHLEAGLYSPNTNGEQFPIVWPNYVNLSGSNQEESIISSDSSFTRLLVFNDVSSATFDSISFHSGGGIKFDNSSAIFNDVVISENRSNNGGGVFCANNSSPIFNRVTFKDNVCEIDEANSWNENSGEGGAVFVDWESIPVFNHCSFINNYSERAGGAVAVSYGTPEFNYCLFTGNMSESGASSVYIGNSPSDSLLIKNSTFYNNESLDSLGSNIECNWSDLYIKNSILRNNQPNEFSENLGLFHVSYSNIEGGFGGFANIDADPSFCNVDSLNFSLNDTSPCVGTGENGSNMGAFGVACSSELLAEDRVIPSKFFLYQNYPNPFNPSTIIRYDLPNDSFVSLTVYDMMGRVVKNLIKRTQVAGFQSVQWDATNNKNQPVSAGIYIYSIYSDSFIDTKKMILVK